MITELDIALFEEECFDGEEVVTSVSCLDRYEFYLDYLEENDAPIEELGGSCNPVEENPDANRISRLANDLETMADNFQCEEEDAELIETGCMRDVACNAGRSILEAIDVVAPDFAMNRIRNGLESSLTRENTEQCFGQEQPSCLSQMFRSFVSNTLGTARSLGSIFSAIGNGIRNFSISGSASYIRDRGSDLLEAARTAPSAISTFMRSPVDFIMGKFNQWMDGIDEFVRTKVYCQEWEGLPHEEGSTCIKPLESLWCQDCDDFINMACTVTGFMASETAMAVASAGAITGLGIAARSTAALMPGLRSALRARSPGFARRAEGPQKSTPQAVAETAATRTVSLLSKLRDRVRKYSEALAKSPVGEAVAKANTILTLPLAITDKVAGVTMERILLRTARLRGTNVVTRALRETAREDFRTVRMLQRENGGTAPTITGRMRVATAGVQLKRASSRTIYHTDGHRTPSEPRRPSRDERRPSPEPTIDPAASEYSGSERQRQLEEQQRMREEQRRVEQERRAEQERLAEEDRRRQQTEEEERRRQAEEEERQRLEAERIAREAAREAARDAERELERMEDLRRAAGIVDTTLLGTRAAIIGDLALKGYEELGASDIISGTLGTGDMDPAANASGGIQETSTHTNLQEQIQQRVGAEFKDEASAQAYVEQMNSFYNDETRQEEIVEAIATQRGVDAEEARSIYDSERRFYSDLNNRQSDVSPSTETTRRELSPERQSVREAIQKITELKEKMKEENEREMTEAIPVSEVILPQNSPTPTPSISEVIPQPSPSAVVRGSNSTVASAPTTPTVVAPSSSLSINDTGTSESVVESAPDFETVIATEEKNPIAQPELEGPPPPAPPTPQEVERAQQSQIRLQEMDFLTELATALEGNDLDFRSTNEREQAVISPFSQGLDSPFPLDDIEISTIHTSRNTFSIYLDKTTGRIIVLNQEGIRLPNIPIDVLATLTLTQ